MEKLKKMIVEQKERLAGVQSAGAAAAPGVTADQLTELKEDINVVIADLNSKIDGVKSAQKAGATVAGRAYIYYQKDQLNKTANKFDIDRVYIDFKQKLDRDVAVRFTTDIGRETYLTSVTLNGGTLTTKSDTRLQVYLKYAYFDLNNLSKYWGIPYLGLETIRVGQSATHWIDFMQSYWKPRYVAKTVTDRYKFFDSADLGLALLGSLNFSELGLPLLTTINYHATLMNGSGYKSGESNSGKDLGLRLDSVVTDFDGNKVTVGLGYLAEDVSLSFPKLDGIVKKATVMAAWQFSFPADGLLFAEYANQLESSNGGLSVGGQYMVLEDVNLIGKLDNFKNSGVEYQWQVLGLEYLWGKNLKLALDYQNETKDGKDNARTINLHSEVKW
jgi:hypothetical protein